MEMALEELSVVSPSDLVQHLGVPRVRQVVSPSDLVQNLGVPKVRQAAAFVAALKDRDIAVREKPWWSRYSTAIPVFPVILLRRGALSEPPPVAIGAIFHECLHKLQENTLGRAYYIWARRYGEGRMMLEAAAYAFEIRTVRFFGGAHMLMTPEALTKRIIKEKGLRRVPNAYDYVYSRISAATGEK